MRAFLVAGLAFGDEGKGSMVDFLCRHYGASLVVRYNGGPQAAHNVVSPEGFHHCFSQFGSGSFIPECRTYLSSHMLVEPYSMINESEVWSQNYPAIENPIRRTYVDERCVIITPWHWMANQIRELARGENKHGSCGMGIGEARMDQEDSLYFSVHDVPRAGGSALTTLMAIKDKKIDEVFKLRNASACTARIFARMTECNPLNELNFYRNEWYPRIKVVNQWAVLNSYENSTVVFEGAQGVLLDQTLGFAPYVTWTDCTFGNAFKILGPGCHEVIRIGVTRTYCVRHGAGPFVTEIPGRNYPEAHNGTGAWQGKVRQGHLDIPALRYSIKCLGGLEFLAVTHTDMFTDFYCDFYRSRIGRPRINALLYEDIRNLGSCDPNLAVTKNMTATIEESLGVPIGYKSWGVTANAKSVEKSVEETLPCSA